MRIGVTGANGFVGSHTVESLLRNGHRVTCLVRRTSNLRWIRELGVGVVYGDLRSEEALPAFVRDQEAVVHLGALTRAPSDEVMRAANVGGTRNLLTAIARERPPLRRLLYVSSQEAAGPVSFARPLTEEDPLAPATSYGRSKAEAELVVRSFGETIPFTIIRPSSVYGPRDKDAFVLFRLIGRGILPHPANSGRLSVLAVANLVHGIRLALESEAAVGRVYYLADDGTTTWEELGGFAEEALGCRARRIAIPRWAIGLGAAAGDVSRLLGGRVGLLNRDKLRMMVQANLTVSTERAKAELGYRPLVTTAQGIAVAVRWYRDQGWL